jgi:hypothetical protein
MLIIKNFLDPQSCNQLNDWVKLGVENKWLDAGLNAKTITWDCANRLTTRVYADRFDYSSEVYAVQTRITEFLNIQDLPKSVVGGGKNGIVVSYVLPSGDVHKHQDPMEETLHVLRCNVVTQAADAGGDLIVDGQKIDVAVGDLHCYLASDVEHHVTTVEGNAPRILWMFGYQCSKERFDQLLAANT